MRLKLLLAIFPCMPLGAAWGAPASPATQHSVQLSPAIAAETVRAANRRAVEALFDQVAANTITSKVTVGSLVKKLDAKDEFLRTFFRADQIGGPRWIDESTVQVQLEVPTDKIVQSLKRLVEANPMKAAITPDQVEAAAQDWPKVYTATGSSASAKSLIEFKPAMGDSWARVSASQRQKALAAANDDATRRVLESVRPVKLTNRTTLADGLSNPAVADRVNRWLADRPVTHVAFRDNLQVEVSLAIDEQDLFDVVRTALDHQSNTPVPQTPDDWKRVQRDFNARFIPAIGHATVTLETPTTRGAPPPPPPTHAPAWVDQQVDAQATAEPVSGINKKLRTALAAEKDARAQLRERIEAMPFDKDHTVGQAAKHDPRVAEAITRAVHEARVYKTIYNGDGSATVKIMADMRDLWEALRR
jgi:hypothetical protein